MALKQRKKPSTPFARAPKSRSKKEIVKAFVSEQKRANFMKEKNAVRKKANEMIKKIRADKDIPASEKKRLINKFKKLAE